jgi:5'-methylthioadenosine phosphorylase
VSDADAGTPDGSEPPVTAGLVWRRLAENQPRIRRALAALVAAVPYQRHCGCRQTLADV